MSNLIKCPYCKQEFEASEALTHQIEEEVTTNIKKQYQKQAEQFLDEIRVLRHKNENQELEMKKKLLEEEDKIRKETWNQALEEHSFKDKEKDKKLSDASSQIEILKQKMQQGSQQIQGESMELEMESKLRVSFPDDQISEIKKGVRGADIIQTVIDKLGRKCGVILWESKNAVWSETWISKLKEDQRQAKADIAILVSVNFPKDITAFEYKQGIWISDWKSFLALCMAMRFNLISLNHEKQTAIGIDEKMKDLYRYLTGNEFKHRVEGIIEAFTSLSDELEKEKRYFSAKWARQEKEIRRVVDHTHGMYGDLQGVIGRKSLPEIKTLELED